MIKINVLALTSLFCFIIIANAFAELIANPSTLISTSDGEARIAAYNAGMVERGQEIMHDFILDASIDRETVYSYLRKSCDCTSFSLTTKPIDPQKRQILRIHISTIDKDLGAGQVFVDIAEDTRKTPFIRHIIQFYLWEAFTVSEKIVRFGTIFYDRPMVGRITIQSAQELNELVITGSTDTILARLLPAAIIQNLSKSNESHNTETLKSQVLEIRTNFGPEQQIGPFATTLTLQTADGRHRAKKIHVNGFYTGRSVIAPRTILLDQPRKTGEPIAATTITDSGVVGIKQIALEALPTGVEYHLNVTRPEREFTLTFTAEKRPNDFKTCKVVIIYQDGRQESQSINFIAM